ncbi:MAG TPA: hypothetical protein VM140_00675 [Burkholderiales bacterium]|nr:hypothetical protein [Burkholderiales bacterium]
MRFPRDLAGCAALLLSVLATGCSTTSDKRVEGWPELAIVEHNVSDDEISARCSPYTRPGRRALACAEYHFGESRCDIWYGSLWLLRPIVVAHERSHCRGYGHAGENRMEEALRSYRAAAAGG